MLLGDIIKQYRETHQMSLQDFAELIGTSRSYIHMLEKNINPSTNKPISPSIETLKLLASAMNMDLDLLLKKLNNEQDIYLDEAEYKKQFSNNILENNKQVFPLLGLVKAGYNYLANENIIGWVSIDKKLPDPENYFALKIVGESMQPILYEDDIVIVHRQNDVESGQVGIVLVDDEEATIKKIIKHEDYIELKAFNSYYPPKKLDKNIKFSIIGKVTEARISKIFE